MGNNHHNPRWVVPSDICLQDIPSPWDLGWDFDDRIQAIRQNDSPGIRTSCWSQFHQIFKNSLSTHYTNKLQIVSRKKLRKTLSNKKFLIISCYKFQFDLFFTNCFCTNFLTQKHPNLNCKWRIAAQNIFAFLYKKLLIKCCWNWNQLIVKKYKCT